MTRDNLPPYRRRAVLKTLAALALPAGLPAHAAQWPERSITFVQPYAPGTATDASSRYIAQQLSERWKVPTVMEHKVGANSIIGTEYVARAAPDGYTFLITSTGFFTNEAMVSRLPYHPLDSFVPVAKVGGVQLLLCVPANSRFHGVKELVEFARANPGKLTYASGGNGSSQHLSGAQLGTLSNTQLMHVPYKAQVPAAVATASGEVDFSFIAIATAKPLLAADKIRVLAVSGSSRSASFPDVPTVAEAGVPDFEWVASTFFLAPANTPRDIVRKLSGALGEEARSDGYREFTKGIGMDADFMGEAEWGRTIAAERQRYLQVVRASGAKAE
ncbi:tripartite tricarboxylate transporter substrate binding protein [Acidovorax sp. MR-S7]|uniref:Bug family tripartite tricarboxylate transporter substrate binding protein n=1 Tax=Acidovorax sp. MR-S7 TaxID=1268622 RepID=UPI0005568C91|nr:tripartite tricarboxylate transporter substrate binding protein [Acidovorax sp. MR-S7]